MKKSSSEVVQVIDHLPENAYAEHLLLRAGYERRHEDSQDEGGQSECIPCHRITSSVQTVCGEEVRREWRVCARFSGLPALRKGLGQ
jgi:hypothetical protein